jgi:DNA-directed RNA polymerase subunit RPC12/RpoP
LSLRDVETALSSLDVCPKCFSTIGFWLEVRHDRVYVQCKACGSKLVHVELYETKEKNRAPRLPALFRR